MSAEPRNPALLKLYCRGARLDDSCYVEGDGGARSCVRAPDWAAGWS